MNVQLPWNGALKYLAKTGDEKAGNNNPHRLPWIHQACRAVEIVASWVRARGIVDRAPQQLLWSNRESVSRLGGDAFVAGLGKESAVSGFCL